MAWAPRRPAACSWSPCSPEGRPESLLPPKALAADERGQNQGEKPDRSVAAETTHTKHPARGPQLSGAAHISSLVRLPRRCALDGADLPLLRRGHGRAAVAVKVPLKRPELPSCVVAPPVGDDFWPGYRTPKHQVVRSMYSYFRRTRPLVGGPRSSVHRDGDSARSLTESAHRRRRPPTASPRRGRVRSFVKAS